MFSSTILQRVLLTPMMFVRSYRTKDLLRRRCADCYVVWRYGRMYIECPKFPRHKTVSSFAKEKGWGHLDWRLAPKLGRYSKKKKKIESIVFSPDLFSQMSDKIRNCYTQARQCINTDKSVRRLLDALASRGCHFDFERHLSCEIDPEHRRDIRGGFDRSTCQIVLFPENLRSPTELCTIFRHELIHAFDYCRVHIDFNRLDHLACTEIRASSLSNECSLGKHLANSSRPFLVKNQHAQCVQQRVQQSMGVICSNTPLKEINESIGRVFTRCYSDTDPFDEIGTGGQ